MSKSNNYRYIIAIDGHSSCGKSTAAKVLAKSLGFVYVDTGAMYRAVTLYFLKNDIELTNETAVCKALSEISISFKALGGVNTTFLNGENVEAAIRTMEVSKSVSPVAALSSVRKKLVEQQQEMGQYGGLVMDGRDIGTVVFPMAEVKFFMTADASTRAQRRYDELVGRGDTAVDFDAVLKNVLERDKIDSTRKDSPLRMAEDGILIDNSSLNLEETLELIQMKLDQKVKQLSFS